MTADPSAPLAVAVDALLDAPPMDQVSFGVLAVEAGTGEVLYARNAHRKFIPASNQKLLVAAAGLSLLGPDYRYETALWASGPVRNGAIEGDLVLVGTGDPSLSARYWESGEAALENLAGRLREAGVRRVRGALVVDASAWDSTSVAPTREVEDLRWEQAATGGVFAIDEGEVTARVTASSEEGELAGVSWRPLGTDDFVVSRVLTSSLDARTDLDPYYLPESRRIELLGHIRVGRTARVTFAQRDPVRQATAALVRALAGAEIEADQGSRVVWERDELLRGGCSTGSVPTCGGAQRLASLRSPPMHELVTGILGPSQNWMAEQLLLTLGAERGEGGSWPDGTEVLTTFLAQDVGVARLDVAPRDASGMSFYNLVTPRALVQVLQYMARGQNAEAFRSALAEPGVDGATLSNRLSGLEGGVFAKTGSISNVNALSGYVVRSDGSEVVFSILSNGSGLPYSRVRRALDGLVRVLAR